MLNIILFGPPGAGKGTQAEFLTTKFSLIHLSTGNLLRSEIDAGTELGVEAKKYMDKGELVPDDIVIEMIKIKLDTVKHAKGVRDKQKTYYCYSEQEKQKAIQKLKGKPEITRFKGLGEISPDEFKHFIGADMRLDP
ncbi:hypothetical protein B566_EDAN019469, partial [Ephemera danica]